MVSKKEKAVTLIAVVVPFLAFIAGVIMFWGRGVGPLELTLTGVFYVITCLGISIGFHRYFTHVSFRSPSPVEIAFAIPGSMAVEGSLRGWVCFHRAHHQHSDGPGDPHSPHHHGGGVRGVLKGLWHAHIGWMFTKPMPDMKKYIPDLLHNPTLALMSKLFPLWVAIGLLLPAFIGGVVTQSWKGAFLGFLWGGLIRVFLLHHATWSVNSLCHYFGDRPFKTNDKSTNFFFPSMVRFPQCIFLFPLTVLWFLLIVVTGGEYWHNNHHAFPYSARHGLHWWQIDPSWYVIRLLMFFRLAYDVKVPSPEKIAARAHA